MDASSILLVILILFVLTYLWGELLDWINLRSHSKVLPSELSHAYDAKEYARSYDYHRTNYRFSLLKGSISFLLTLAALALGWFGLLDEWLREHITVHPIGLPLVFFGVMYFLSDWLSLPFQWYKIFVIEEKFGFNKMTKATFVKDKLKGYVLSIIMGGLVIGALFWLVDWMGEGFWIWFWLFISAFSLFMTFFYASIFLPIFNKLTPLEDGELRTAILEYAQSVDFPLNNVFVMDGSRRSSKANAFFSGFGKQKRIVLFDTLIENHSTEELVAVLAHEVGHYKRRHIQKGFVINLLQTGAILYILSLFVLSPALSAALGASELGIHLNLIAFMLLFSPISSIIGVAMNFYSRKNEFEADHYAATTYEAQPLKDALVKLHQDNLSNLTPHPLYVFMHYSHPPLLERLKAI